MTTMQKFTGQAPNYSTYPKVDVEILDGPQHCDKCEAEVTYDPNGPYGMGKWVHTDPDTADHGFVAPRTRCRYCHTEDRTEVAYRQHAWYDAVECERCGGVDGRPLGD